jgi:hypothetical protein
MESPDVLIVVLKSGLQLIAEVETSEEFVTLIHPMMVVISAPRGEGKLPTLGFSPYLQYTKNFEAGVMFKQKDVLTYVDPVDELKENYLSHFSPIIRPSSLT